MMPNVDASNFSGFGYLYSFEVAKCLLGSVCLELQKSPNIVYPFWFENDSH